MGQGLKRHGRAGPFAEVPSLSGLEPYNDGTHMSFRRPFTLIIFSLGLPLTEALGSMPEQRAMTREIGLPGARRD